MSVLEVMGDALPIDEDGLLLREWSLVDVPRMVRLFDTREVNRWTPLPSPFNEEVAAAYVRTAHALRHQAGTLQLAICPDSGLPEGEVIAFAGQQKDVIEIAYALGLSATGHGFARHAVGLVVRAAARSAATAARLQIDRSNGASQRVAVATGFNRTGAEPVERRRKGYVLHLEEWQRPLTQDPVNPLDPSPGDG